MNGFVEIVKLLVQGPWPPAVLVGVVLFVLFSARFDAQDQRLESIERQLFTIERELGTVREQGVQNRVQVAVLEERMKHLVPVQDGQASLQAQPSAP